MLLFRLWMFIPPGCHDVHSSATLILLNILRARQPDEKRRHSSTSSLLAASVASEYFMSCARKCLAADEWVLRYNMGKYVGWVSFCGLFVIHVDSSLLVILCAWAICVYQNAAHLTVCAGSHYSMFCVHSCCLYLRIGHGAMFKDHPVGISLLQHHITKTFLDRWNLCPETMH